MISLPKMPYVHQVYMALANLTYDMCCHKQFLKDWPEPFIYTVCDRIIGDFPAQNAVYTPCILIYPLCIKQPFPLCIPHAR